MSTNRVTPAEQMQGLSAFPAGLIGLMPLLLVGIVVLVALALAALVRQLVAASGFFVQQEAAVIVLIVGFVLALGVFLLAVRRVLRRVSNWQQNGSFGAARLALWMLSLTALVVILPVVLAIVLPQHPAP